MEGTNTMFWRTDCDGGDECGWSLAKSAAFVRDAKPESDVHSNFQNKGPLWKTMVSEFECGPPGEFNPSWEWAGPDRTYPHRGRLSQTVATSAPYTDTVTRGSTARATRRAVPLPKRRRPPKVLVCLQKFILCQPFRAVYGL